MEAPLTMTVREAGKLLGLSRSAAYEAVARKELPVVKIGKRILISRSALIRMIDSAGAGDQTVKTGPARERRATRHK